MTFLVIPIDKHLKRKKTLFDPSASGPEFLILDSHYKKVIFANTEQVVNYVDNSKDYNLVLIGEIY